MPGRRFWAPLPYFAPMAPTDKAAPYRSAYAAPLFSGYSLFGIAYGQRTARKQELDFLKSQARYVQYALDAIEKRMEKLEAER